MAEATAAVLPPREYEVVYILRPDVSKETAERIASRVDEVIKREGGTLTRVENWGRRPLAYEIQHKKRGLYVYLTYLGSGALVAELERNFRMLDDVMRYQTVKVSDNPVVAEVDAEAIKFVAEEPPVESDEDERSLEQELGLIPSAHRAPRVDDVNDYDDDDDMDGEDD